MIKSKLSHNCPMCREYRLQWTNERFETKSKGIDFLPYRFWRVLLLLIRIFSAQYKISLFTTFQPRNRTYWAWAACGIRCCLGYPISNRIAKTNEKSSSLLCCRSKIALLTLGRRLKLQSYKKCCRFQRLLLAWPTNEMRSQSSPRWESTD